MTEFSYADFADLKNNSAYDRFLAGHLQLPTGQVVCTDPMHRQAALPQTWRVTPGSYPVYLYIALAGDFARRVAYAELVLQDAVPDYWELSLIPEELLASDFERMMNGMYPVENGLGCFTDYATFQLYNQEIHDFYAAHEQGNYYRQVLEPHFRKNSRIPASSRGQDWVNYTPAHASTNIIMFGSGYGDGIYPRYVGFTKDGQVVKLLTDFIQLVDEETE